jgi:D-3-phosphoglycerate dehydrogenase
MPSERELLALVDGCVGWLAGVEQISAGTLAAARDMRVISRNGAGADAIDHETAQRLGIRISTAAGANAQGVAELTVLLILAALRELPRSDRSMHEGEWARLPGRELADRTVGIVGLGAIGRIVARIVSSVGAKCVAYDPYATDAARATGVPLLELAEVFSQADIVTLHCPPKPDGSPLVTDELLRRLPARAVLVNTARSALVDDDAVLAALNLGGLATYAVDAFDSEPPALSELLMHERTIATPHLGGYTDASSRRAVEHAVANLLDILETTAPRESSGNDADVHS